MKAVFFSACDVNNFPYAITFWNSMTKFHSPEKIDMILYTNQTDKTQLAKLPKGVKVEDISKLLLQDKNFWYRQKPVLMEPLMEKYELVVGFDVDQFVVGSLDYILNTKDYDVGTVINWNRIDPKLYGFVQFQGVMPAEYFNCGLVAARSKKFVHHWRVLCFSQQFDRLQYREQDLLNVLAYYGNYNVRCFDIPDGIAKYAAWHGLIVKGELGSIILRGNDLIVSKGIGPTPFPPTEITVKVIHIGGGNQPNKMNFRSWFSNEEVIKRIEHLIAPTK